MLDSAPTKSIEAASRDRACDPSRARVAQAHARSTCRALRVLPVDAGAVGECRDGASDRDRCEGLADPAKRSCAGGPMTAIPSSDAPAAGRHPSSRSPTHSVDCAAAAKRNRGAESRGVARSEASTTSTASTDVERSEHASKLPLANGACPPQSRWCRLHGRGCRARVRAPGATVELGTVEVHDGSSSWTVVVERRVPAIASSSSWRSEGAPRCLPTPAYRRCNGVEARAEKGSCNTPGNTQPNGRKPQRSRSFANRVIADTPDQRSLSYRARGDR